MMLIKKEDYNHAIKITTIKVAILGIIIGLAWGFCAGLFFEQYCQHPKPPALIVMRGIEF
ncbi:MAG: hypothetical protein MUP27_08890 [Desulfobacterales bacterium]|nr:hypothetical protein [Desulfobacterales bacterium]